MTNMTSHETCPTCGQTVSPSFSAKESLLVSSEALAVLRWAGLGFAEWMQELADAGDLWWASSKTPKPFAGIVRHWSQREDLGNLLSSHDPSRLVEAIIESP